jgi:D-alanyl-lipoteichoic acid acyltransferase DltB (MBOAT superfamily)
MSLKALWKSQSTFFWSEFGVFWVLALIIYYFIFSALLEASSIVNTSSLRPISFHVLSWPVTKPYLRDNTDEQLHEFTVAASDLIYAAIIEVALQKLLLLIFRNQPASRIRKPLQTIFSLTLLFNMHSYLFLYPILYSALFYAMIRVILHLPIRLSVKRIVYFAFTWSTMLYFLRYLDKQYDLNMYRIQYRAVFAQLLFAPAHPKAQWQNFFNFVILRMISFAFDQWRQFHNVPLLDRNDNAITFESHRSQCDECAQSKICLWWRERANHSNFEYNFLNYFAYLFYTPLYIAGPIMNFNSFVSYLIQDNRETAKRESSNEPPGAAGSPIDTQPDCFKWKYLLSYSIRILIVHLILRISLSNIYIILLTNQRFYSKLDQLTRFFVAYWILNFIWLKFSLIWKFFRLWSLCDGVGAPENMGRCVNNNYSVVSFWQNWHRSFNRWLVYYLYIPLGGSRAGISLPRRCFNIFLVFAWVGYWHDRTKKLWTWGWITAAIFVPELCVTALVRRNAFVRSLYEKLQRKFPLLCKYGEALLASLNIVLLVVVNNVGFSSNGDRFDSFIGSVVFGGSALLTMIAIFFVGANLMFSIQQLKDAWAQIKRESKQKTQ